MCVYKSSWGHVKLSFKGKRMCVCGWVGEGGVHTQGQSLFLSGETLKLGQFSLWGGLSPVLNSVNHAWREHARSVVGRASLLMASLGLSVGRVGEERGGQAGAGGGAAALINTATGERTEEKAQQINTRGSTRSAVVYRGRGVQGSGNLEPGSFLLLCCISLPGVVELCRNTADSVQTYAWMGRTGVGFLFIVMLFHTVPHIITIILLRLHFHVLLLW